MDAELAQIAEDGFNSIILVIPWREFQPGTNPIAYNTYPWDKLDRVMEVAAAQNLSVMLRVGYTWDYYGRDNVLNRFQALLYDEDMRLAWLELCEAPVRADLGPRELLWRFYHLGGLLEFHGKCGESWKGRLQPGDGREGGLHRLSAGAIQPGGAGEAVPDQIFLLRRPVSAGREFAGPGGILRILQSFP